MQRSACWYCKHPACMYSTAHLSPCTPRIGAAAAGGTHLDAATGLPPHLATPPLSTRGTPHPSHHHLLLHYLRHRSTPRSAHHPSTATHNHHSPTVIPSRHTLHSLFSTSGITARITGGLGRKTSPYSTHLSARPLEEKPLSVGGDICKPATFISVHTTQDTSAKRKYN